MARRKGSARSGKKRSSPSLLHRRKFGSDRARGIQVEYGYRRLFPLTEGDLADLDTRIGAVVKANRRHYKRFFVSLLISVLGGLYQVKFGFKVDEDSKWEHQWVSTPVVDDLDTLLAEMRTLLDDVIHLHLQERPAWLLRFRVVMMNVKHREDLRG